MIDRSFMQTIFQKRTSGADLLQYLKMLLSQFGYKNKITDDKSSVSLVIDSKVLIPHSHKIIFELPL